MDEDTEARRSPLGTRLDRIGAWDLIEPPDDFADAVLRREAAERAGTGVTPEATPEPADRSRWRHWLLPAALGAAATILLASGWAWVQRERSPSSSGAVTAGTRQTIALASHAVAVADAGARLSWRTRPTGQTRVQQDAGAVFYRVDKGAPVRVDTPAGHVDVLGTCFAIDIRPPTSPDAQRTTTMPNADHPTPKTNLQTSMKAGALGAALTAAVFVTVYEGRTVLANDAGAVTLQPGERAVAHADRAPERVGTTPDAAADSARAAAATNPDLVALRADNREQAAQIESLRQQLAGRRGAAADGEAAAAPPRRFGRNGPPMPEGFDYYQPTEEALLQMAECGVVAWDQPPVWADDEQLDPQYLDALQLSASERATVQSTFERFQAQTVAQARAFWVELGGDPAAAEAIDPSELLGLVYGRTDVDVRERTREQMSMERAGLAAPAVGDSTTEALVRWDAELGNAFEAALADSLGAERAQALRAARGGWSGKRSTWADLCNED